MSVENGPWFGPAEMAQRLGVTPKALRVYEREGLVAPHRTEGGWRAYGPAQVERLHLIIALRDLGLTLKRIGQFLDGGGPGLSAVLTLQQQALEDQRRKIDRGLSLLAKARRTLDAGGSLTLDDLTQLTRETVMQTQLMSEETERKWKAFMKERLPDQALDRLADQVSSHLSKAGIDKAQLAQEFGRLMDDIRRVMQAGGGPDNKAARAAYLRWYGFLKGGEAPRADTEVKEAMLAGVNEALADPDIGPGLPFDAPLLAYLKQLAAGMKARGELAGA